MLFFSLAHAVHCTHTFIFVCVYIYVYVYVYVSVLLLFVQASGGSEGGSSSDRERLRRRFFSNSRRADIYSAYGAIYGFLEDPFVSSSAARIFQACRFLLNTMSSPSPSASSSSSSNDTGGSERQGVTPFGVSRAHIYFALAKNAKELGAFKLARTAHSWLRMLKVRAVLVCLVCLVCLFVCLVWLVC